MQCDVYQQFLIFHYLIKLLRKHLQHYLCQKCIVVSIFTTWINVYDFLGVCMQVGKIGHVRLFFVVQNDTHNVVCAMMSQ